MDREAWWAIVHGVAKESDMTHERLTLSGDLNLLRKVRGSTENMEPGV